MISILSGTPLAEIVCVIPFHPKPEERRILASFSEDTNECGQLEGRYANYFKVGHNAYEFVIDFGQMYEDSDDQETIHSRIITSPTYVRSLIDTLKDAIGQYESSYGKIESK